MRVVFVILGCVALTACSGAIRSLPLSSGADRASGPIQPAISYKSIFSFSGSDGAIPYAGLVNVKGTLYGTTSTGDYGGGVVFKITPAGAEKVLYGFKTGGAANSPYAPLIFVNGALYGTTTVGGPANCGSVFRVTLRGAAKTLHDFKNNADGCLPIAPLLDVKGILYGTTRDGGAQTDGTVFKITSSGSEKVLYAFKGSRYDDAGSPAAGLTDVKGVLYGATNGGGPKQDGTVFRVTFSGSEKVLHVFNGSDGNSPLSRLLAVNGTLYGTTASGGAKNLGTVFSVSTSGKVKVLHSFRGGTDGATPPFGGLVDLKGAFYGVTSIGGKKNTGTIFRITPAGKETVLYSFGTSGSGFDGANPSGTLTYLGGRFFGTTTAGGANGKGTVYSIRP
ncbi:MAG TPA: choice-of-anchor tandem repeat GloVer-containing protein [Candidatus Binatia bacterium]|nr:choice-of-anchor tandem repeat GloVer-containing protein [Candidatus Binatia bacterium]